MKGGLLAAVGVVPALVLGLVLFDDPDPTPSGGSGGLNLEAVPAEYRDALTSAAQRCAAVTGPVLAAQIEAESNWNPAATSRAGAQGISQFMPATWQTWGKDYSGDGVADVWDPTDAIGSQADYMCHLSNWVQGQIEAGAISGDPLHLTLAAYNAGPGTVQRAGGIPSISETRTYVSRILSLVPKYTAASPTGDYAAGTWPAVSADGTYRVSMAGSGRLDPSTLCQIPWSKTPNTLLRCDAVQQLAQLDGAFYARFNEHLAIDGAGAYRDYNAQVRLKMQKPVLAAEPGKSNHGWGLAADISNIGGEGTAKHQWLRDNARTYGWDHPTWARRGGSKPEPWHWEYVGS